MFRVVKNIGSFEPSDKATKHTKERQKRITTARQLITSEKAFVVQYSICDTGHKNGLEVHAIYNNGVIFIYNMESHKLVTVLIARVPHMERYGITITKTMKQKIKSHIRQKYNRIMF